MPHQPELGLAFSDDINPQPARRQAHMPPPAHHAGIFPKHADLAKTAPAAEPPKRSEDQHELSFGMAQETGYFHWHDERRQAIKALSQRFSLPLEHPVEVWLKDGVRLAGKLELRDHLLFVPQGNLTSLELKIGRATFTSADIDSCVRMD